MFEKESKEYANKWLEHVKDLELQHKSDEKPEYIRILEAHQKGAEFGYNKTKTETTLLSQHIIDLQKDKGNLTDRVRELEQQIEKMKSDVKANIKWADKNCDNMWQKLVKMWNQWEIKEK